MMYNIFEFTMGMALVMFTIQCLYQAFVVARRYYEAKKSVYRDYANLDWMDDPNKMLWLKVLNFGRVD